MRKRSACLLTAWAALMLPSAAAAVDDSRFRAACTAYYESGADPAIADAAAADAHCRCAAEQLRSGGYGQADFDFLARSYSEDATSFVDEDAAGEETFDALARRIEPYCKEALGLAFRRGTAVFASRVRPPL